jgi:hypothetical protein
MIIYTFENEWHRKYYKLLSLVLLFIVPTSMLQHYIHENWAYAANISFFVLNVISLSLLHFCTSTKDD